MNVKKTPLHQNCLDQGARMVSFAGWDMPIQFSGLVKEHHEVREKAGIFDISHMGVLSIKGNNPKDVLQKLVPSDLYRIGPGEACYTVLLNENGGIIDDLIIYDLGTDNEKQGSLLVVINASCTEADTAWLKTHLEKKDIKVSDAKQKGVLLALQGPDSKNYLEQLLGKSLEQIPRFGHRTFNIQLQEMESSCSIFIARTGYTGEDGYEILLEAKPGKHLWETLINEGVTPCGLGARDTLRLEAAMHLYGNEITEETTPLEAGLGWLVHLEMSKSFIGRKVLEKQTAEGIHRKLIGIQMKGKAIARTGYKIIHKNQIIGEITSGSWSPTLERPIAMGYVPIDLAKLGTDLDVQIRGKLHQATIVKKPFYRRNS